MPDLLLELFCEEIPARMQTKGADDLRQLVTDALVDEGLTYEGVRALSTPRRLTLSLHGLSARSRDVVDERKGPRTDAPQKAIEGFLRGAGLTSIDDAEVRTDPKKGEFYVAIMRKSGRDVQEIIADLLPDIIRRFPWPKSMRWGASSVNPGSLRWVRPLQSIVCTFGPETEDPEIIHFDVDGVRSGDVTYGHRFHAPEAIRVKRLDDYATKLEKAHVICDPERRKDIIRHEADERAFALGLEVVQDEALLSEVAGLVEWPMIFIGTFDETFLEIPPEVIRLTIRENQKCFVLRERARQALTNRFVITSNIAPSDGGLEVTKGNERVVRARLADAKFFWETDLKTPLEDHVEKLKTVTFHEKLGSQFERVERLKARAITLAPLVGADSEQAVRAATLCKADLLTEMVFEFPELQGLMGRYYATKEGEHPSVALAMEDHYKPQGPSDAVPKDKVAITVALADKLDLLTGFWAIDEKPTGSKDPFALRRAALGVIRIIMENRLTLSLKKLGVDDDLLSFFHDRLKVYLRDKGARYDLIDAMIKPGADDLGKLAKGVEALGAFLEGEEGRNLLAGVKRAANILTAEEKKGTVVIAHVTSGLLEQVEEQQLFEAIKKAEKEAAHAMEAEDFEAAMTALAVLRGPVDAFFDNVLVNAEDENTRLNRLSLLDEIRRTTKLVADFSQVSG